MQNELNKQLCDASYKGQVEVVNTLIQLGVEVNATQDDKFALQRASEAGHQEIVKILIRNKANIDQTSRNGSALHTASGEGHTEIAKILIASKANIDEHKYGSGSTPLHLSLIDEDNANEVTKLLIHKKANINEKNNAGFTALHWASIHGSNEIVELLIHKKATINEKTSSGNTALHWAEETAIVKTLIYNGAKVDETNNSADFPLDRFTGKEIINILNDIFPWLLDLNLKKERYDTQLKAIIGSELENKEKYRELQSFLVKARNLRFTTITRYESLRKSKYQDFEL